VGDVTKKKDINFRKAVIFEENVLGLTVVRQICFVFTILQFSLSFYQTLHRRAMTTPWVKLTHATDNGDSLQNSAKSPSSVMVMVSYTSGIQPFLFAYPQI
jgi:hypothetical protein